MSTDFDSLERQMDGPLVVWSDYADCPGLTPDPHDNTHTCPLVLYYHKLDGKCVHNACEGPHDDCGEIIMVVERKDL